MNAWMHDACYEYNVLVFEGLTAILYMSCGVELWCKMNDIWMNKYMEHELNTYERNLYDYIDADCFLNGLLNIVDI